jgi:hypothetical protein
MANDRTGRTYTVGDKLWLEFTLTAISGDTLTVNSIDLVAGVTAHTVKDVKTIKDPPDGLMPKA